jgi:hypothetical protein
LSEGLIDSKKLHQVMDKIKQLAKEQLASGSKEIDYSKLIEFLKDKELGFVDDRRDSFEEPVKADGAVEEQERWNSVVDFMRSNPKLLMQMIPDPDSQNYTNVDGRIMDSNCLQQAD